MKRIQIGVIGTGGMGTRHVQNLTHKVTSAQVVAVMDVDGRKMQAVAAACGATHTFADGNELINHPDVEAVLIAAPDRFHAQLTRTCITAGKPVLCEKPLATNASQAYQVIEAEVAGGQRLVQVGFMREYDPAHVKVKQIIASGDLGKALAFRGSHSNPTIEPLRPIEDVITNSVIHDIHSARWMMDEEIESVYTNYVPSTPERPDTARLVLVQLRYRNGSVGQIHFNSEAGYGYEVDVEMTGETGSVHTNSLDSALVSHKNQRAQWVEEDHLQRFENAFIIEAREWVRALQQGAPSGPSAWDGYVSILVADACIESAKSGRPVAVQVPDPPDIYTRRA